jgi:alanine racemase
VSTERPAWAEIDLGAIAENAALLARVAAPAALCAVVKADGYGHGALPVAEVLEAVGVPVLAVALASEGVALREGGITRPILVLSECAEPELDAALAAQLTLTVYSVGAAEAAARAARRAAVRAPVHLKLDTGMHRAGVDPEGLLAVAHAVAGSPDLVLDGFFTHLAVADEPDDPYTAIQLDRFGAAVAALGAEGIAPRLLHVANSAATLVHPDARFDLVRCGIACYGHLPGPAIAPYLAASGGALRPAMSIRSRVGVVRTLPAGERPSYGRRIPLQVESVVATIPIGYADGLPRSLGATGGAVLIGGVRCPIAGTVTMDQIVVDCGPASTVAPGDEVVLIGRQGDEEITAEEWAERTGTIAYEVLCRIGPRLPRRYIGGEGPVLLPEGRG